MDAEKVFCAIVQAMQGQLTVDNLEPMLDEILLWTKVNCDGFQSSKTTKKAGRITVRKVTLANQGVKKDGSAWRRYEVIDSDGVLWSTFHRNLEVNQTYAIEYTENERGCTIIKYTEVADYDDSDIPY